MDSNERDERVAQVREQIAKLEEVNVESLSDEDLESVAGGCSVWCCTNIKAADAPSDNP
jgi:hypothetical protein